MIVKENVKALIYEGMKETCDVVSMTFGPYGKNIIINNSFYMLSCDGYKVCNSIKLDDEIKNVGTELLKSISALTKECVKDGTTSTIILTTKLCECLLKYESSSSNLLNEIDRFEEDVIKEIDRLTEKIGDRLYNVVLSSSNDSEIARIITDLLTVNSEMSVLIKPSFDSKISFSKQNGICYERGLLSPYLGNNDKCILKDAYVIVVNDSIEKVQDFETIIYEGKKSKNDLLVIGNSFSKEVVDYVSYLRKNYDYNISISLSPDYGYQYKEVLEDIAIYVNTYVITNKTNFITLDTIGYCDRVEIDNKNTIIYNKKCNEKLKERIAYLKALSKNDTNSNLLKKRISMLEQGVFLVHIPSRFDYKYLIDKEKIENAIATGKNAIKYGVIAGGGEGLSEVKRRLAINDESFYNCLVNSLDIIKTIISKNSNNANVLTSYDSSYNLKMIVSNSISMLRTFQSIDGYIESKPICEKMDFIDI